MRRMALWFVCVYALVVLQSRIAVAQNEKSIHTGIITQNDANILSDKNLFDLDKSLPEDGKLDFCELATKYGHECVAHEVVTADGYILKVFNIKGDKNKAVLTVHGVVSNSDVFISRGNGSLVINLAKNGYDVWAGNCRGSQYSRGHKTLDPDTDKAYWDFSQHELGIYDLPAMVDLVLDKTGQTQVQAIGHSQGNHIFYILGAEKPEYNVKIKLLIALAPICFLQHAKAPVAAAIKVWPAVSLAMRLTGLVEVFSRNSLLINFITTLCTRRVIGYSLCASVIFAAAGFDAEELEPEFLQVLFANFPDAVSFKNMDHFVQIADKKRFSKFDYGWLKNLEEYGTVVPPNYKLASVSMPVALLVGNNDNFATLKDVDLLRAELPNVVYYRVMERKLFNHVDFVWGKNMEEYLFPLVLDLLQLYQNEV